MIELFSITVHHRNSKLLKYAHERKSKLAQLVRLDERHAVSMRTGRWSELSEEHEVRCTGNDRFVVITISRTSGVTDVLYDLVVGEFRPKIRQEFSSA